MSYAYKLIEIGCKPLLYLSGSPYVEIVMPSLGKVHVFVSSVSGTAFCCLQPFKANKDMVTNQTNLPNSRARLTPSSVLRVFLVNLYLKSGNKDVESIISSEEIDKLPEHQFMEKVFSFIESNNLEAEAFYCLTFIIRMLLEQLEAPCKNGVIEFKEEAL